MPRANIKLGGPWLKERNRGAGRDVVVARIARAGPRSSMNQIAGGSPRGATLAGAPPASGAEYPPEEPRDGGEGERCGLGGLLTSRLRATKAAQSSRASITLELFLLG